MLALRKRLSIEDKDWDEDFRELVSTVRANDIAPADLTMIAAENADDLLYHAKNEGRDRAEFDAGPLPEVREVVRW